MSPLYELVVVVLEVVSLGDNPGSSSSNNFQHSRSMTYLSWMEHIHVRTVICASGGVLFFIQCDVNKKYPI